MREYNEQLYANTFDNLNETYNFFEKYQLSKFIQKEINWGIQYQFSEIECVVKNLSTNNLSNLMVYWHVLPNI